MAPTPTFRYDGFAIDAGRSMIDCHYSTGEHHFTEQFTFASGGDWDDAAVVTAVRILYLLAGVSYYKTTAAPFIDLGDTATTQPERAFLRDVVVHGLGEFAFLNRLDLSGVTIAGPDAPSASPVAYHPQIGRPLIPFGGGIDSIVTVEGLSSRARQSGATLDAALFVVHPPGDRFVAIEDPAAVTGLPITRVERAIDPRVRRSSELGFLNGHVPVTAIITAAAVVAAVLARRDAVVLSNERSASEPTLVVDGHAVNHQWSKGEDFERSFGELLRRALGPDLSVFSYLRPRSELWVAERFAALSGYHHSFRSCNRAFHQDPAQRLDHWCGRCDKCCFIDLILSPFMARSALAAVFSDHEPLENPENVERFENILGLRADAKPFECVGDLDESRAALLLAAQRDDRVQNPIVQRLRDLVTRTAPDRASPRALLEPRGPHRVPDRYAPADLLVRAR